MKKSLAVKNPTRLVGAIALFSGVILGNSILSFENAVAKPVEIGKLRSKSVTCSSSLKVESYCCKY